MKCRNCTNLHLIKECKNLLWCDDVLDAPDPDIDRECEYFKHATNADRIRAMSDEELAETYAGGCPNEDRLNCGKYYLHGGRDCFNCWLNWLKAPVEEGKHD